MLSWVAMAKVEISNTTTVAIVTICDTMNVRHMCEHLHVLFLFSNCWPEYSDMLEGD